MDFMRIRKRLHLRCRQVLQRYSQSAVAARSGISGNPDLEANSAWKIECRMRTLTARSDMGTN
jgi:hypothetical protein